jgi:hypothetical protein
LDFFVVFVICLGKFSSELLQILGEFDSLKQLRFLFFLLFNGVFSGIADDDGVVEDLIARRSLCGIDFQTSRNNGVKFSGITCGNAVENTLLNLAEETFHLVGAERWL